MDTIERAAEMLFSPGHSRVLNFKFGTPARGKRMSAVELAQTVIDTEEAIRTGNSRLVEDIDA